MDELIFKVDESNANKRIDQYLSISMPQYSRNYIKKLISNNNIEVNNKSTKPSNKVFINDVIKVTIPEPEEVEIKAQNLDIDIIYEDKDLLVVNKSQGMVVHPAPGNYENTLVNSLMYHIETLSGINGQLRPGIVHRIDKDTSGLLMVAKNDHSHKDLAEQLKEHSINRRYLALVEGIIPNEKGTIDAPIGRHNKDRKKMAVTDNNSKSAITHFVVKERFHKHTLIEAKLETGRTHQIRVHMNFIGHPVVGDKTYGYTKQKFTLKGQLLHAYLLGFKHPSKGEYMEFELDLPEHFQKVLDELRGEG